MRQDLETQLREKLGFLKKRANEEQMTLVITRLEELESLLYLGVPAPRVWDKVRTVEIWHFED